MLSVPAENAAPSVSPEKPSINVCIGLRTNLLNTSRDSYYDIGIPSDMRVSARSAVDNREAT
jgi:hypothetical protein